MVFQKSTPLPMTLFELRDKVAALIAEHGSATPCSACILLPDDVTSNGDRDLSLDAIESALKYIEDSTSLRDYGHDLMDDHLRSTGHTL